MWNASWPRWTLTGMGRSPTRSTSTHSGWMLIMQNAYADYADGRVTYQEYFNSFSRCDADFDYDGETYADKGQWCEISRAKGFYFYYFLQFLDGCLSLRVTFLINSRFFNFAACTAVTICAALFLQFFKSVADNNNCNCYSRCRSQLKI